MRTAAGAGAVRISLQAWAKPSQGLAFILKNLGSASRWMSERRTRRWGFGDWAAPKARGKVEHAAAASDPARKRRREMGGSVIGIRGHLTLRHVQAVRLCGA